jgi:hypothetical protein
MAMTDKAICGDSAAMASSHKTQWDVDEAFERLKKQVMAQHASAKKQKTNAGYRPAGSSGLMRLTEKQVRKVHQIALINPALPFPLSFQYCIVTIYFIAHTSVTARPTTNLPNCDNDYCHRRRCPLA